MKFVKLLPYLFLLVAGALAVPTLISKFNGEPSNNLFEILSPSCLVLALIGLPYSHSSVVSSRPSNS